VLPSVLAPTLSFQMVPPTLQLSAEFRESALAEREKLLVQWRELRDFHEDHARRAEKAAREAERVARAMRELGEILGIEDQLSIVELSDDLRGERLREVAAEVLWRNFHAGDVVHYKQWLELVVHEGHRIGGKNPTATFLTQVARIDTVERVGKRSGLYRLIAA
jgi:hypothetical protein